MNDTTNRPLKGKIDGLMQKRRNSIANALELRLFGIKPSRWCFTYLFLNQFIDAWSIDTPNVFNVSQDIHE